MFSYLCICSAVRSHLCSLYSSIYTRTVEFTSHVCLPLPLHVINSSHARLPYLPVYVRIVKIISPYVAATGSKMDGIRTRCKMCAITVAQSH